ncbi:MAG: class I SAM-dependent methyltransferase [Verrucomicrobiae bacterium]|nr:class I SAM-dependent methyltransferase [Verrucomicrobiae bacterium]
MKFPIVTRRQLQKVESRLSEATKRIEKLRQQNVDLKNQRDEARLAARAGFADIGSKSRHPRKLLATALEGEGIEIGALHFPLPVPDRVRVKYVDLATREENIQRHPNLDPEAIVETDYVCDGETLEIVPDESQDFVIANHMLEHCINPLRTLNNFLRVLKPGGLIFLALPDKRFTFDVERPITPFDHIEEDFRIDRTEEDLSVYEDWTTHVGKNSDPVRFHKEQKNIHFHVWTQSEILEMFIEARRRLEMPFEIEWAAKNGGEFIVLVRKYGQLEEAIEKEISEKSFNDLKRP